MKVEESIQPLSAAESVGHAAKALGLAFGVSLGGVLVMIVGWSVMWAAVVRISPDPARDSQAAAQEVERERQAQLARLGPPGPALDPTSVARGKQLYEAACVTCHGMDARGVRGMGKDLVTGRFSLNTNDKDLVSFIGTGRAADDPRNTTKMPMPARGGRADYTDDHLDDVVKYVRSLQDSRRLSGPLPEVKVAILEPEPEPAPAIVPVSIPVATPATPIAVNSTNTPAATPSVSAALDPQAIVRGKKVFNSCMACHAKNGAGVPKMGANLIASDFVRSKNDQELLDFIKKGRQPGDPESKLKLAMPPKGGNPTLKDNQLQDVVVYLRSLQQAAADKK